ncbi:reverse transcriptase domain, reverse transcriptase zinc-binding domain protein [Tanacetum coccineum]
MISVSGRCGSKTLYIRRSFRSLWQKPNLQGQRVRQRAGDRNKSKSWKIGEIKYRQNITCCNCNQKSHFQNQCSKLVVSRDKVVNMAAGDSDDALVCCVENTVEDRIMDSGASLHATYCKEELERFKLRSGKVRLADDKTLDIAGVGDVVLKTSFGSLMVARGNKRESLYMVEVHPEEIGSIIDGSGSAALIVMLKMVSETPLQFGVAERLSRTFRAESMGLRAEAAKMLWADSVSTAYLIYRTPYVPIGLRILEEEWPGNDTSLAHLKLSGYEGSPGYPKQRYYICGLDLWSQVDFEKAYNSINWRFLIDIMRRMNFGNKWCTWVETCLRSSSMSILVNGSPTKEFGLERGVRQGDPLSPFLFIIAAEGLNAIVKEAVVKCIFKGILWEASGLKINLNKSKLYGVGVTLDEMDIMARYMGCSIGESPFLYLELPIGLSMRRVNTWRSVVEKFKRRLTEWRSKTMSFGRRMPLIKSVLGSLPLYYFSMFRVPSCVIKQLESVRRDFFWGGAGESKKMSWVKWDTILSSYGVGGLNIRSIYGIDEGLGALESLRGSSVWGWNYIIKASFDINKVWVGFTSSIIKKVRRKEAKVAEMCTWVDERWSWVWDCVREPRGRCCSELEVLVGPLVYPMVVGEDGHTRPKKYPEITEAQQLQDDCDVQATNIILHGLLPDVLYNLFDKFASVQGETLYEYYWRFSQLINDMHTIRMTMQQVRQGEDPIDYINKAMAFLSAVTSRFPSLNNQPRTSSNLINQATIQDGEGHMAKQFTQPKRLRNYAWFKEKLMLVEAQEAGQILYEEQLTFIADLDCDDISSAKAVLMTNLSSCDSDVLFEVPYSDAYPNDMINQDVQEMSIEAPSELPKSVENSNLNAQLQEKVFAIATLKNELRKLKGKNIVDTAVSIPIAPGMFKLDIEPIYHRLKNNRDAHEVYLKKTIENTDTIHGLVECARKQNPSEPLLHSACMFTKHVQELLVYVSKTCPSLTKPSEKLVVVTPLKKDKKVRFANPLTSLSNS